MATYFGETMAKVLGGGDGKAAAADFGGKLRIVNERVPLVNGFAFNDTIVVAQVPQGAGASRPLSVRVRRGV